MSHLHVATTEELQAEIQRRKADRIKEIHGEIGTHEAAIAELRKEIWSLNPTKVPSAKATRTRGEKIDPVEADLRVLSAVNTTGGPHPASALVAKMGIDLSGPALKASLSRLEASKAIKRTGKARATVYEVAKVG
jgi:hypothetical protein